MQRARNGFGPGRAREGVALSSGSGDVPACDFSVELDEIVDFPLKAFPVGIFAYFGDLADGFSFGRVEAVEHHTHNHHDRFIA